MKIAVIDYNMGNLGSVLKALRFLGADAECVTAPEQLAPYKKIILPGVGNFGDGMKQLRERGFDRVLKALPGSGKICLGICLGMQMLLERSEEAPGVEGLGIFPGSCLKFDAACAKVPQIGWNTVSFSPAFALNKGLESKENWFYFVHSYYVPVQKYTAGTAHYIHDFSAALAGNNFFAMQCHPEKSSEDGLTLLRNFLDLAL